LNSRSNYACGYKEGELQGSRFWQISPQMELYINILQQIRNILPAKADMPFLDCKTCADMAWCPAPPLPVMVAAVNFHESRSDS